VNDNILNWGALGEKPTEEGLYLCCRGDVENSDNMSFIRAKRNELGLLVDTVGGDLIEDFWHDFKFAKLST
jgi:hypothetical protein